MRNDWNNNGKGYHGFFAKIVEKANKTANSEVAKKIRKQLLVWGTVAAVVGFVLLIVSIVSFVTIGFDSGGFGFNPLRIALSFVGFIISSAISSLGITAINAGLAIVVAGITTDVLDVNQYCPNCHDIVEPHEIFCNKCGYDLRADKKCPDCGRQNDFDDEFCTNCGTKL